MQGLLHHYYSMFFFLLQLLLFVIILDSIRLILTLRDSDGKHAWCCVPAARSSSHLMHIHRMCL